MYQYYIYGLGIHSEIKLYNLEEVPSAPDVTVRYTSVPDDIAALTAQGLASSISSSRIWFRNDSGHFIIRDGNEILVSPLGNADEKELASFTYNRTPGPLPEYVVDESSFLDYFLLESKEGFCTHFATAFVLLARADNDKPVVHPGGLCRGLCCLRD